VRAAAASENKDLTTTMVGEAPIDRARVEARTELKAHIAAQDPYAAQTLVADLLQAMGHVTAVAPPGADGGTDIFAYPGPFGAGTPHIRAQVKHRVGRATREEIAALRGILAPEREIGLFVSFGGFTAPALRETGTPHIRLIDLDGFLDLWVAHYDALSDAARDRLPLAPVYFLKRAARATAQAA
jgi:restriction system protein